MSMSKRLLFDRNPLDDEAQGRMRRETADNLAEFTHRLAMKRKGNSTARYWDPRWPMSIEQAVSELGIDVIRVNDGMFTREEVERDEILERAEEIWRDRPL
ncbi:MAG: hypothetical protein MEP57_09795 [Microvirga sp.]|nr:hypothetical protein [Microvirga sp.]